MLRVYIAHPLIGNGTPEWGDRKRNIDRYLRLCAWFTEAGHVVLSWAHHCLTHEAGITCLVTRTAGVLDHIRRELDEVAAAPDDVTEWVDVILLALDGAWRAGHSPEAIALALAAKQAKNEGRVWPDWRMAYEAITLGKEAP